jgi:DNA-binding NarL/FixJ family response regulator
MSQFLHELPGMPVPHFGPETSNDIHSSPRLALHRVALYSPHPLLIAGLKAELAEFPGFQVVAETGSPTELMGHVERLPLSLIIFDPARPGETLRLVRAIQKRLRGSISMIILNGETKGQVALLKDLGVIPADKMIDTSYFRQLVEQAVNGRRPLPGIRFNDASKRPAPLAAISPARKVVEINEPEGKLPLSQRELQILAIIGQGCTNKEVAETLCISSHTLKNHLNNIFKKLAVEDRTQALMFCVRRGWVTL